MTGAVRPSTQDIDRGILDAAARTFAVHGYAKTSVQQLADAVGYSKAGLLHRFPSKRALHDAALGQAADVLDEILDGPADGTADLDPAARTRATLERVAARALDRPGLVHLLVASIRPGAPGPSALHARLLRLVALLHGGHAMFAPVLHPLERPAQEPGGRRHRDLFRIDAIFWTEAAAHVRRDDPEIVFLDPRRFRDGLEQVVRHLRR